MVIPRYWIVYDCRLSPSFPPYWYYAPQSLVYVVKSSSSSYILTLSTHSFCTFNQCFYDIFLHQPFFNVFKYSQVCFITLILALVNYSLSAFTFRTWKEKLNQLKQSNGFILWWVWLLLISLLWDGGEWQIGSCSRRKSWEVTEFKWLISRPEEVVGIFETVKSHGKLKCHKNDIQAQHEVWCSH